MNNEETIYMGSDLNANANNNRDAAMDFIVKAWKPVTIGGSACIMLGTGAILMTNAQDEDLDIGDDSDMSTENQLANAEVQPVEQEEIVSVSDDVDETSNATMELPVAIVDDKLTFPDAFALARAQVGPGGVFNWRSLIFSTYTADEWNGMTDEQHEQFAMRVHPEVDASHVSDAEIAQHIAMAPVEDAPVMDAVDDNAIDEINLAQNDDIADDEDAMYKINEDMAAVAAAETIAEPAEVEALAQDVIADFDLAQVVPQADEDVVIADEADGIELADISDDVMIAGEVEDAVIEDIALVEDEVPDDAFDLSDMFDLKSTDDLAMAPPATKASDGGTPFENFLSDNSVRIVGYGEFDGHQVRGLDLDGDNMADIAVIDIDDSGDLSSADMVVEQGNGNQFTYGELQDFAMNQDHGDDNHEMHTPNPEIADDMPDYMDDAIAQL